MMTPDKATALREAAERATPGPWQNGFDDLEGIVSLGAVDDGNVVCLPPGPAMEQSSHYWPANAAYIALADPPTILALLAERERLRGALETIRDIAGTHGGQEPDYSRLDRIDATARQALEATDDQ